MVFCLNGQDLNKNILADQYYANEEFDKALELYKKLYKKNKNLELYTQIIRTKIAIEEYDAAIKTTKSHFRGSNNPLYLIDQAILFDFLKNTKQKNKFFNLIIEKLSNYSEATLRMYATRLNNFGKREMALMLLEKACSSSFSNLSFFEERLNLYIELNKVNSFIDLNLNKLIQDQSQKATIEQNFQLYLKESHLKTLKVKILHYLQRHPSNVAMAKLYIWYSIYIGDYKEALRQLKSIDKREKSSGRQLLEFGNKMKQEQNNIIAKMAFNEVINIGHRYYTLKAQKAIINMDISGLDSLSQKLRLSYSENIITRLDNYAKAVNKTEETQWSNLEKAKLLAFKLYEYDKAKELLNNTISDKQNNITADCKLLIGDIALFTGDPWEAILLYSQVESIFKGTSKGDEAKYKVAKASYYIGDFEWAQIQLNVLKGSSSKLISNDALELSGFILSNYALDSVTTPLEWFAKAQLSFYQEKINQGKSYLDSIKSFYADHPLMDDVFFQEAKLARKNKSFNTEIILLEKIIKEYSMDLLADKAIFRLAYLSESVLKNKEKAIDLYEKIILEYADSLLIAESRKHYNRLKKEIL